MRALITAPSRSPPGRGRRRNERRKHKLKPLPAQHRYSWKGHSRVTAAGHGPQAAQEPFCCSVVAPGAGHQQDKTLIDVQL